MSNLAEGAWAATVTPLNDDLSIDYGAYGAHMDWLLAEGAAGIVALGTTGEANSFSMAERLENIAFLGKRRAAADQMMIGAGCAALGDTLLLTRAAIDAGYPNVLLLPPFYYKNVSEDGVFAAFAQIIEAVKEPAFRAIIYDIPGMSGVKIPTGLLARLKDAFPGVVIGVKNSSGDWSAMDDALKQLTDFSVFCGSEQFLLQTLRGGGPGCITATSNVNMGSIAELARKWRGEDADVLQADVTKTRLAIQNFPVIPALKELLAMATGRPQWRNSRPPLVNLTAAQRDALKAMCNEVAMSLFARELTGA